MASVAETMLRDALCAKLAVGPGPRRLMQELGLRGGQVRADVATVDAELLCGYEIKSERDTTARLELQVPLYDEVFDFSFLVVHATHGARVREHVPAHWGIVVAQTRSALARGSADALIAGRQPTGARMGELVEWRVLQEPRPNPNLNALALTRLLWRDEAWACARQHAWGHGHSGDTRVRLQKLIERNMGIDEVRAQVRTALLTRPEWRAEDGTGIARPPRPRRRRRGRRRPTKR